LCPTDIQDGSKKKKKKKKYKQYKTKQTNQPKTVQEKAV
jgi:hypothetical protein